MNVPFWSIPFALTVIFWLMTWSIQKRNTGGEFSRGLTGFFYGTLSLIATLVVWLIYFIIV